MKSYLFFKILITGCLVVFMTLCFQNAANAQIKEAKDSIIAGANIAVVESGYGKVRGYIQDKTYIFKGLPYARAERFMPPVKPMSCSELPFVFDNIDRCREMTEGGRLAYVLADKMSQA